LADCIDRGLDEVQVEQEKIRIDIIMRDNLP